MAARRGKSQARRTGGNGTPGWVWLVAGAAIAAVVFMAAPGLFKKDGDDFLRVGPRSNPDAQPAPVADADVDAAIDPPKPAASVKDSGKPDEAQTQYDFYTLLPGKEVQMSDAELAASARAEAATRARNAEAARARAALEGKPVAPAATTAPMAVADAPALPRPLAENTVATPAQTPAPVRTITETTAAATSTAHPPSSASTSAAPASAPVATATSAPKSNATGNDNSRYILQAGSFGASGDAETTKAKLAMLGLSARVESADINGKTVYRVRMGPYASAGELAEAKQKLTSSGLPAIAIKAQ